MAHRLLPASGLLAAGLGLATVVVHHGPGVPAPDGLTGFYATNAVTATAFGVTAAVVLRARPGHRVGLLLLALSLSHGVTGLLRELGVLAHDADRTLLAGWLLWGGSWPWLTTLWFPLLLLLLPDGRLAGRRWRWSAGAGLLAPLPLAVYIALEPGAVLLEPLPGRTIPANPVGLVSLPGLAPVSLLLFAVAAVGAVCSLVVRWRRGGQAREQLTWVGLAGGVLVVGIPVDLAVPGVGPLLAPVAVSAFAVAVGIAVVRHRLLDVDVVLNRTLVYAALTASLVGVYVSAVTLLGEVLRSSAEVVPGLVASGLVAAVAAPLRNALQGGVDRLFFGRRDDPLRVLRALAEDLDAASPAGALAGLAATIARALRLPFVRIVLPADPLPTDVPADVVEVALRHQEEQVGTLLLAPRGPGERLSAADERLLGDLARQAAAAAHAVLLTQALQSSREQLVVAREEERRRLRRDLHDGLGPLLAAVAMQLDAARRLLGSGPESVDGVLREAKREVQEAVVDVRRLVDDLRPAALDELGLVGALRALADRLSDSGLVVTVEDVEPVDVSAAVEVAAYRIAAEALTNVARHAHACSARIVVAGANGELCVVVEDDGVGLPVQRRQGVGLGSITERAAELGGSADIVALPGGGTRVTATLPLGVRT